MPRLSKALQDQMAQELLDTTHHLGGDDEALEEEWEAKFDKLDVNHQLYVDGEIRRFADNAVGSTNWDSDEKGFINED